MSIKILTKNSIDNTNIDGARQNHFSAGMRSGIVKGAFNEGKFFASASNIIALDSCELRISGHQVVIDSTETITLNDRPSTPTKYSMIAEIQVSDSSVPSFRLFIQPANVELKKDNLFKTDNGSGTYQLRIGNFTLNSDGNITDVFRTTDIITGGNGAVSDIVFNASAIKLSADSEPEANVDYNEETGEYDFVVGIPVGSGEGNTDLTNYYTKDETYSKEEVDNLIGNIEVSGGSSVVVDSELDAQSENPVQNKVITQALKNRYTKDETYSQQQVDDLISGIETGGGTSIIVDSELNNESENPVQNKVLYNPVVFAESERQKSETDGAIVHEKEIADVEHIQVIYDKDSTDSNINWGKTSGIGHKLEVTGKNFSKYKKLKVLADMVWAKGIVEVDLTKFNTEAGVYFGSQNLMAGKHPQYGIYFYSTIIGVNNQKTSITPEFYNVVGEVTNDNAGKVLKIEGVY